MKNITILILLGISLVACTPKKQDEAISPTSKSYFKVNTLEVSKPKLSFSTYKSSGCNSEGSITISGTDKDGKPVELTFI